jgi:3-phenylpropionate/cinnamic acid dioxygenase small subunit
MTDQEARDCKSEVRDLFDRYVTLLDEKRYDEWLDLFTDDGYYAMILHDDYVKENNMTAIGEDKARLAGRIEVGRQVERDLRTHLLTAVRVREAGETIRASSNFAVLRNAELSCAGRYHMDLVRRDGDLKIERCTAVLDNDVLHETFYLPV